MLKRGLQEGEGSDCKATVFGLTQLLKEALYRPGPLAEQVFSVLVAFLQQLYAGNCFTATSCVLRINVSSFVFGTVVTSFSARWSPSPDLQLPAEAKS